MRKLILLLALTLVATAAFAQQAPRPRPFEFATDFQTVPVMANTPGLGGTFQSYVSLYNPTASAFSVTATLYDSSGTKHEASIPLAAGELKAYTNFLDTVFQYTGGGAVTFRSPDSAGGQRNNRFIVNSEVRTSGTRYSTSVPVLDFAGSSSRSFSPGVTVDSNSRTNVGCFNQSDAPQAVAVTVLDSTGKTTVGTTTLVLPGNAWGQAPVNSVVSNGLVQFDPTDNAVCYAVVVDNSTNDGRFIAAAEYRP